MFHQLSFRAMGSDMLALLETDANTPPSLLKDVPAWFEEWEQSLSRFRLDSELSRLNRTFDQPVAVSETLWHVFQTAVWANEFSQGLVIPTVLNAMLHAGYDRSFDDLPHAQSNWMASQSVEIPPLSLIVTDSENHTINLPQGVCLDFGGVAKGWAAHRAMERLREIGPCLMNAGGDIAVSGPRLDGSAWQVGLSNPFECGKDFDTLDVLCGGVASSGKDRRRWKQNGHFRHHIINPNTGEPVETEVLRVTVVAPTAQEAEAAAKTAFILGSEQGLAWMINTHPSFAGLIILEDGEVLITPSMQGYLQGVSNATTK
jgi:thiamine biosynthesis lipoprotein